MILQFATEDSPDSALIRAFGGSPFSHVDAVLPDGLLGARFDGGVKVRKPGYAPLTNIRQFTIPMTTAVEGSYEKFLRDQVDKPYDMTAIMAFAFNRNWREPDSWFCSELIAAALESAKFFPHQLCVTSNRIDPGRLLLVLSALVDIPVF